MPNNSIAKRMPLSPREKKVIRKVTVSRLLVFLFMISPLLVFAIYINYLALASFFTDSFDKWSVLVPLITLLLCGLGSYHIFPFYRNIFSYSGASYKAVTASTVVSVDQHYSAFAGIRFRIETTAASIDTSRDIVLLSDIPFMDLKVGMPVFSHKMPGTKNEYLRLATNED